MIEYCTCMCSDVYIVLKSGLVIAAWMFQHCLSVWPACNNIAAVVAESEWKLLLIRQRTLVGTLAKEHSIYKINKIAVLSLSNTDPTDLDLEVRCALELGTLFTGNPHSLNYESLN